MIDNCNGNKTDTVESYKTCKLLYAILNRYFASSTCKQLEKTAVLVLYTCIHIYKRSKPNAKTIKVPIDSGASMTLVCGSLIKKIRRTKTSTMPSGHAA